MKEIKFKFWLLMFGMVLGAVSATYLVTQTTAQQTQPAPAADNEYQVGAVLFFQTAAENRALFYQAFNLARLRLDAELKGCKKSRKKMPCAIVTDVDETVLDNSPNQAWMIKNQRPFNQADWQKWVDRVEAKPLPGALDFFNYAARNGIKTFYVTNRTEAERAGTAENLKKAGFPEVTDETLLLRADTSSKEPRRRQVAQKHRIVLLVGDNLNDLAEVFERKPIAERFAAVDSLKNEFGNRFIVLPNPMYGEWESAVYDYKRLTEEQKERARQEKLQSY
ncbi:MAG: 5'-nucleotidase, lipoprotein e(P4) family [Acidobacteriota bacterium]|nr:5'-nucleotidase, lipoprotein e(P4) family [Acidobacteriota bacterium]